MTRKTMTHLERTCEQFSTILLDHKRHLHSIFMKQDKDLSDMLAYLNKASTVEQDEIEYKKNMQEISDSFL